MKETKKNIRLTNIVQLLLGVVIIILVNIISARVSTRFDLTSEKRYTLSEASRQLLSGLTTWFFSGFICMVNFRPGLNDLSAKHATCSMNSGLSTATSNTVL